METFGDLAFLPLSIDTYQFLSSTPPPLAQMSRLDFILSTP